jgi:hypothetical protein
MNTMETKQNKSNQSQSNNPAAGKSGLEGITGKEGLNNIKSKLQDFSSATVQKVNSLSTTQKVVGGSLLALGAGWITMNSMSKKNKDKIAKQASNLLDNAGEITNKLKQQGSNFSKGSNPAKS